MRFNIPILLRIQKFIAKPYDFEEFITKDWSMFYRMVNLVKLFTHSNGINFKIRIRQVWIQYLVLVKKKKTNFLGLKVTSFLYLLPFQYTTLKLVRETQKRRMKRLIIVKIRKGKSLILGIQPFQNPNLVVRLDGKKKS